MTQNGNSDFNGTTNTTGLATFTNTNTTGTTTTNNLIASGATNLNTLNTTGNTTLGGNLSVAGNQTNGGTTTLNGNLSANGASNTINNLTTTGTTNISNLNTTGTVTNAGNIINNGSVINNNGTTTTGGTTTDTLNVNGPSTFEQLANFIGGLVSAGITNVGNFVQTGLSIFNGDTIFNGNTTQVGNVTNTGNLIQNGNTTFNGNTTTTGNNTIGGNQIVSGTTTNTGLVTNNGGTITNGNNITNGNTITTGTTTTNGIINTGTTNNTGAVTNNGNVTNNNTTTNNGLVTNTAGTATTGGTTTDTLNVTGNSNFNGIVNNGTLTQNGNVTTNGNTTTVGNVTNTGNLTQNGDSTFNGNTNISGNNTVGGNQTVAGNTITTGTTTANGIINSGSLNQNGPSTFGGPVTFTQPISLPNGTAESGTQIVAGKVRLGGNLLQSTIIGTDATNTLALAGLLTGSSSDLILIQDPITGVIKNISTSGLLSGGTTNVLTGSGTVLTSNVNGIISNLDIQSLINAGTTVANISNGNNLSTTVNGVTSNPVTIINNNGLTLSGTNITSNVNGVTSTLDILPALAAGTTNNLSSALNTLTSNVNGIISSSNIINSNSVVSSGNNFLTSVNGVISNNGTIINSIGNISTGNNLLTTINGVAGSNVSIINSNSLVSTGNTLESLVNGISTGVQPIINSNSVSTTGNLLTSTVNGVISGTAPIINSNGLSLAGNNLTTTVNGVASTALDLSTLTLGAGNVTGAGNLTTTTLGLTIVGGNGATLTNSTVNYNLASALGGLTNGGPLFVGNSPTSGINLVTSTGTTRTLYVRPYTTGTTGLIFTNTFIPGSGSFEEQLGGILSTANGGTGLSTVGTAGQVLTSNGTTLSYASAAPAITTVANNSIGNILTTTVNGATGVGVNIINSNTPGLSGTSLINTINGIASTPLDLTPAILAGSTNSLTSAGNVLNSTVNGISQNANIINSGALTNAGNTLSGNVNGVSLGSVPIINSNLVATSGNLLTSTVNGVVSGLTPLINSNNFTLDQNNGFISTVNGVSSTQALPLAGSFSRLIGFNNSGIPSQVGVTNLFSQIPADNGLTNNGGTIQLGGTLNQSTAVDGGGTTDLNLANLNNGIFQANNTLTLSGNQRLDATSGQLINLIAPNISLGNNSFATVDQNQVAIGQGNNLTTANQYVIGLDNQLQGSNTFIIGTSNNFANAIGSNDLYITGSGNNFGSTSGASNTFITGSGNNITSGAFTFENILQGFRNDVQSDNNAYILGRDNVVKNAPSTLNYILGNNNTSLGKNNFSIGQNLNTNRDSTIDFGFSEGNKITIDNTGRLTLRGPLSPNGNDGNSGEILVSNGSGSAPSWATAFSTANVNVGNGLTNNGSTIQINSPTCASNQRLSWNGSAFVCVTTTNTLTSAGNVLTNTTNGISATANIINSIGNTSAANTLLTTVNGVAGSPVNIINSNVLANVGNTMFSTINGVPSSTTVITSNVLGLSGSNLTSTINGLASNTINLASFLTGSTTNNLSFAGNTITSNVNGVTSTANIPNANTTTLGLLTATDWNTFNTKVSNVNTTGVNSGIAISGTAINPLLSINGLGATACTATQKLFWNGTAFSCTGENGITSLIAIGSTPNANGGTIAGNALTLQPASSTFGGVITTGTQSIAGAKTFVAPTTTFDSGIATSDTLVIQPNTAVGTSFAGTLTTANLSGLKTWTLPDVSGNVCISGAGTCVASAVASSGVTGGASLSTTTAGLTITGANNLLSAGTINFTPPAASITNAQLANSTIGLTTGTTGTSPAFTISPVSLGGATSLNIPFASASGVTSGTISKTNFDTFNNKFNAPIGTTTQYIRGDGSLATLDTSVIPENGNLYYTTARENADFDTRLATKTTTNLTEGTNLYFTNSRAIGSTLTGFTPTAGTITATDSVLQGLQKLQFSVSTLNGSSHSPVTIGATPNGLSITAGQVLSLGNASTTTTGALTAADFTTFNNKLTSVANGGANSGITIGGTATNPTVAVTGLGSTACTATQKLFWNGAAFSCATDNDTTYTAGTGLSLTGTTFANTGVLGLTIGAGISNTGTASNPIINNTGLLSIAASTGTTGLTLTPTTTSGAVTQVLAGTLGTANGGTGLTTVGTAGQVLTSNGTSLGWASAALGWLTTGNAGTNPATNYIGTSDAQNLSIRTNGTERINIGSGVPAIINVKQGVGNNQLLFSNTVGGTNLFIGSSTNDFYWQSGFGNQTQYGAYHGIDISGGRTSGIAPVAISGTAGQFNTRILNTQDQVGLITQAGVAAPTLNATQIRNLAGITQSAQTFSGTSLNASGTVALPAYSFLGNPNTGIYNPVTNQIGFSTNGTQRLIIDNAGLNLTGDFRPNNLAGTTGQILTSQGAGVSPIWTNAPAAATVTGANNGLTLASGNIGLGGALSAPTTITTTATNTLSLAGIQASTGSVSNLVIDATGKIMKQQAFDATVEVSQDPNLGGTTFTPNQPTDTTVLYYLPSTGQEWIWNGTTYVTYISPSLTENGLTTVGTKARLGGTLLTNTNIAQAGFNLTTSGVGGLGLGIAAPVEKLDVAGKIRLASGNITDTLYSSNTAGLALESQGNTFGTVRLTLQNISGSNGALFEQIGATNPQLVDFGFKTVTGGQRNLRFETRSGSTFLTGGSPEFEFGAAGDPTFITSDTLSSFRKGFVGFGGNLNPSQAVDVTGNIRFSGALMPNNLAGTTGQVLTSQGTGVAPIWTSAGGSSTVTNVTGTTGQINVATGTTTPVLTLANSGVTAGTYNNLTVDAFGRATSGSNVAYLTSTGAVTSLNGATGTLTLSGANSIIGNGTTTPFALSGDSATPGNSFYYGTNSTGTKGYFALTSGGTTETASNGLNKVVNDIKLGGTLTQNTTIDGASTFALSLANSTFNLDNTNTAGTTGIIKFGGNRFISNFGTNNTFVGSQSGNLTMTGSGNVATGTQSLFANTTGSNNVANGYAALTANTSGNANIAIGFQALGTNTTGSNNIAVGFQTLAANTTGINNTANGFQALNANTIGINNTANGFQTLKLNTSGNNNTANGYLTLAANSTGSNNTGNGFQALAGNTTGNNNTANGFQALFANTTGINNTANGYQTLTANTTGNNNTANGYQSLLSNTTGTNNIANGFQSLTANTTGINNTANGFQALNANTIGGNNTANGYLSLALNTSGNNNSSYGYSALTANTTGINNTANGFQSLFANNTGNNNTGLGYLSGYNLTAGDNNIAIGQNTGFATVTGSNQLNIGNLIFGTGLNGTFSSSLGSIGIGTNAPTEKLDIAGNVRFSGALMPNNLPGTTGQVLTSQGAGVAPTWTSATGVSLGTANGLSLAGQVLSLGAASTSATGALTSTDWNTFNNKENTLTFTGNGLFSRTANSVSGTICATTGQILKWNGTTFVCAADVDTVGTAGTGLSLTGTTFANTGVLGLTAADTSNTIGGTTQNPTISTNLTATGVAATATVASGSGLEVSSGLSLIRGCTNDQVLKWNNVTKAWACANDTSVMGVDLIAQKSTALTTPTISVTPQVVLFNTETQDINNAHNPATGQYISPVADTYEVNATMEFLKQANSATNDSVCIAIQRTAVTIVESCTGDSNDVSGGPHAESVNVTASMTLALAQQVQIVAYSKAATTTTFIATANTNFLQIKRVGNASVIASDFNLKKDIKAFDLGLKDLMNINTVSYLYNGKAIGAQNDGVQHVGIIAQDLQPTRFGQYAVKQGTDGYLRYDPTSLLYATINGVKELNTNFKQNTFGAASLNSLSNIFGDNLLSLAPIPTTDQKVEEKGFGEKLVASLTSSLENIKKLITELTNKQTEIKNQLNNQSQVDQATQNQINLLQSKISNLENQNTSRASITSSTSSILATSSIENQKSSYSQISSAQQSNLSSLISSSNNLFAQSIVNSSSISSQSVAISSINTQTPTNQDTNQENIFQKLATFIKDIVVNGTAWIQDLVVKGSSTFQGRVTYEDKDAGGFAIIKAGQSETEVVYEKAYEFKPIVNITVEDAEVTAIIKDSKVTGFKIKINPSQAQDVIINWSAKAVKGVSNSTSTQPNTASSISSVATSKVTSSTSSAISLTNLQVTSSSVTSENNTYSTASSITTISTQSSITN